MFPTGSDPVLRQAFELQWALVSAQALFVCSLEALSAMLATSGLVHLFQKIRFILFCKDAGRPQMRDINVGAVRCEALHVH